MRITTKINRMERYERQRKDIKRKLTAIVGYGLNEIRNTAVNGIMKGTKSGAIRPDGSQASAVGEYPATDTGFLQSNIYVQKSPSGLSGSVVSQAKYSSALEFGTSKMGARPFMQPSAEEVRPKIRRRARSLF